MAIKTFKYFDAGVGFKDQAADNITTNGVIYRNGTKLKAYIENAARELVTTSQTQTLTNKTIDASLNTVSNIPVSALSAIIDTDLNTVSLSHDTIPSAKATKDYVDAQILTEDAANEIAFTPAGTIAATNVQAAVEEVSQDHTDHLNDTVDAHDASAISSIASGNLAATDVQSALNELQSDIDSRALSSSLITHINDVANPHVVTKTQVGLSNVDNTSDATKNAASATLTNKTITGASIQTPTRLDVKQDTKANLITYALTAANGQIVFATDTKEYFAIKDTLLSDLGGGGGIASVDILSAETADKAAIGDFTQTGLEILDTPIVLHGIKSFRLQHATSIKSFKKVIAVDRKFRGKNNTISLDVVSTATNANLNIIFRDETNSVNLGVSQAITTGSQAITATTANASNQLTGMTNTVLNSLKVGMVITGSAIPVGTTITAISSTAATMSQNATGVSTGIRISDLVTKRSFSVDIPANCLSFSWAISTVVEANAESYIDDVVVQLTSAALMSTSVNVPKAVINDYAARIANNGTATITSQTGNIIQSVSRTAAGLVTVNLLPGAFNIAPAVTGVILASGASFVLQVLTVSTTAITLETRDNGGANALTDKDFSLVITKQGTDFIDPLTATESKTIPLTSAQLVQQSDSNLVLAGPSSFGSANTAIRRLANIVRSTGNDVSYQDSSTLGSTFTILTEGIYSLNYSDNFNSADFIGLTRNSSQLSTSVNALTDGSLLSSATTAAAGATAVASWTGLLFVGDIIRLHSSPSLVTNTGFRSIFSIAKQGSLRQLNLSSDSKITIPTHQLRFEGASSRGSTDTAIVKFDTQAITQGDGFSVVNTAANGTVVTMLKAGKLLIETSLSYVTPGDTFQITKNQLTLTSLSTVSSQILSMQGAGSSSSFNTNSSFTDVVVGDKIRIAMGANPGSQPSNHFSLSLTENSIAANFSNVLPQWSQSDSAVRMDTGNGFGSTNTSVRRFANNPDNFGTAVTYVDSATLGGSFTINEDGLYTVSYTEQVTNTANAYITKNQINTTAGTNILAADSINATAGDFLNMATEVYLVKGDVIRAISANSASIIGGATGTKFTISKVGKPNLSSVDVTSFVNMKTVDTQTIKLTGLTAGNAAVATGFTVSKNTNTGIVSINTSTGFITALKSCTIDVSASGENALANGGVGINLNGVNVVRNSQPTTGQIQSVAFSYDLVAGDTISIIGSITSGQAHITATADNNAIASPTQQVSSDTMQFAFKATAIDPNVDAIGTFNTYTFVATSNTPTISATAPTQTTASMNANGMQVFARAANAASTTASPARVDVFLGKGLQNVTPYMFKSVAKSISGSMDVAFGDGKFDQLGFSIKEYNPTTGILQLDAGIVQYINNNTFHSFKFADGTEQANGYVSFSASKSPSLVTIPNLQQRVAYLSDVKSSGTSAGASISGTQTRTLNTIVDNTGVVTSLVSNQFILSKGTYRIDFSVSGYAVNLHKARIRNITDSTTVLIGSSEYAASAQTVDNKSQGSGEITITNQKTFELQHYTTTVKAVDGLGTAVGSGENEVYAQVTITKIKD